MRGRGRMERTDRDKRSFCSFIREVFVGGSTLGEWRGERGDFTGRGGNSAVF